MPEKGAHTKGVMPITTINMATVTLRIVGVVCRSITMLGMEGRNADEQKAVHKHVSAHASRSHRSPNLATTKAKGTHER